MIATVASTLDLPSLAEEAAARGLRLVPFGSPLEAQAALVRCDGDSAADVGRLRAAGWRGPLMLVLPEGGCVARALDAGADDALAAPAPVGEIAARLAARIRGAATPLTIGGLRIDPVEQRATRSGRPLWLSAREFALLLQLARAGGTVSRAELLASVWGLGFDPGTNVVEVHVSRLRAKLDKGEPWPMLRTVKGRGYALVAGP